MTRRLRWASILRALWGGLPTLVAIAAIAALLAGLPVSSETGGEEAKLTYYMVFAIAVVTAWNYRRHVVALRKERRYLLGLTLLQREALSGDERARKAILPFTLHYGPAWDDREDKYGEQPASIGRNRFRPAETEDQHRRAVSEAESLVVDLFRY